MSEKTASVRISKIEINNFKNVVHGEINLGTRTSVVESNVLGIYGQNGSGKTALIQSLTILRQILIGEALDPQLHECINVNAECATLLYEFNINKILEEGGDLMVTATYELTIGRTIDRVSDHNGTYRLVTHASIKGEKLSITSFDEQVPFKKNIFIKTEDKRLRTFGPLEKYNLLVGEDSDKGRIVTLLMAREKTRKNNVSFVFSKNLIGVIENRRKKITKVDLNEIKLFKILTTEFVLRRLTVFGLSQFFVVDAAQSGYINLNALPLRINSDDVRGVLFIPLNQSAHLPEDLVPKVEHVVESLNLVLVKIIPGLKIGLNVIDKELDEQGRRLSIVQLISRKNSKPIPLRYESEGIKKIISILHLLVSMYNDQSVTVVIDELDSGVFEYLLGEVLKIISEKGLGQLIFTSHNLRPLETINEKFIVFTSSNNNNCYARLSKTEKNENLRAAYFRNIILNYNKETMLYNPTDDFEIARAFRLAGRDHEK